MQKIMFLFKGRALYLLYLTITVLLAIWFAGSSDGTNSDRYGNFTFEPSQEEMGEIHDNKEVNLTVIFPHCELNYTSFDIVSSDEETLYVKDIFLSGPTSNNTCHHAVLALQAKRLGVVTLTFTIKYVNEDPEDPCSKEVLIEGEYEVTLIRRPLIESLIFLYGTGVFLIILNFGFGCNLDLEIVKSIIKKPIAPGVGFFCQYFMMPLLGFAVAMTLLKGDIYFAFGLICSSCSPGGAGSNVWCLLLGGDVDLSLTMTFFSLSASLGMMPLWLFLLGRFFIDTSKIKIPYFDILLSLGLFIVPCFIGIIIRKFKQPVAEKLGKLIKPLALFFIVFLVSFGLYSNRYIYSQIKTNAYILIPALLQPYLGFIISFTIAKYIAKQPKHRCITIAIETGVQNVTIPMVLLQRSFPQPYGDLAAVMPVTTAHFTPLPMLFSFIGLTIYKKVFLKYCVKRDDEESGEIESKVRDTEVNGQTPETNSIGKDKKDYRKKAKDASELQKLANGPDGKDMEKRVLALENFVNGLTGADIQKITEALDKESVI